VRGTDETRGSLLSYVDLEDRIPARHPLRKIGQIVNHALASRDGDFDVLYSTEGRPSIVPEPEPSLSLSLSLSPSLSPSPGGGCAPA
jgi:transposase